MSGTDKLNGKASKEGHGKSEERGISLTFAFSGVLTIVECAGGPNGKNKNSSRGLRSEVSVGEGAIGEVL